MSMDVKGTLIQVLKSESGVSKSGKEWVKQDFVIETNEQFPKKVCFTLFGDKTSLIDGIVEGSEVEVFFNLESREYNGKYFHNINCWKLNVESKTASSGSGSTGLIQKQEPLDGVVEGDDAGNELPF